MIDVFVKINNNVVKGNLDNIKKRGVSWVDVVNPTTKELQSLSDHSGISLYDLNEHLVPNERPNTFEFNKYSMMVFACPGKNHKPTTVAIYILGNNNVISVHKKELNPLNLMKQELEKKNVSYFDSGVKIIRVLLEKMVNEYFNIFEVIQEEADNVETRAFHNPDRKLMKEIFGIKKKVMHLHKSLTANREVMVQIEKEYLTKISRKEIYELKDIRNDLNQLIDISELVRELVTSVIDVYQSSVSNQMNTVIKKLTVAASYVLIPTLIASIYGMNFRSMPEFAWKYGYPFAIAIMGLSIIAMYVYFKKSHWL